MPIMIFDRSKNKTGLLQFISNADVTKPVKLDVKPDGTESFRAHNYASRYAANGEVDSNGPWPYGAYQLTLRKLRPESFRDANHNRKLDPGEVNKLNDSYSGRGFYRFDDDVPFYNLLSIPRSSQSYGWQVEAAAVGFRSSMDIHAGRANKAFSERYTLGCIRVDDATLAKLDELHGITATTRGASFKTALLVVDENVKYVATKSWHTSANVALVDPSLYGGKSVAALSSGSGKDYLFGGNGANTLKGGADNDKLFGRKGNDTLYGQAGADRLEGGAGNDQLYAGRRANDLESGTPNVVDGGKGNDTIWGAGNDQLIGQQGDDRIFGSAGHDTIRGDYIRTENAPLDVVIADPERPLEKIAVSESSIARFFSGDGPWKPTKDSKQEPKFFDDRDQGNDTISGGSGEDNIFGGGGNDVLWGDDFMDTLMGGTGNDILYGGDGQDFLNGGPGRDHLEDGSGHDIYYCLGELDTIIEKEGFGADAGGSDRLYFDTPSLAASQLAQHVDVWNYIGVTPFSFTLDVALGNRTISVGNFGSTVNVAAVDPTDKMGHRIVLGAGQDTVIFAKNFGQTNNGLTWAQIVGFDTNMDKFDLRALGLKGAYTSSENIDKTLLSGWWLEIEERPNAQFVYVVNYGDGGSGSAQEKIIFDYFNNLQSGGAPVDKSDFII